LYGRLLQLAVAAGETKRLISLGSLCSMGYHCG
jgi:hypothetical protein